MAPTQTQIDDAAEQQTDEFEQAVAEALAPLIAQQVLSGGSGGDDATVLAWWSKALAAAVGLGLLAFLRSAGTKTLTDLGVDSGIVPRAIDATVEQHQQQVLTDLAASARTSVDNIRAAAEGVPEATDGSPGAEAPPAALDPQEVRSRAGTAASRLGREAAMQGREGYRADLARSAGILTKAWRTRRDDRVRLSHAALEGERQPLDEPFLTIDGDLIRYPGDPAAPLRATAGCRCHLSYRIEPGTDYQRNLQRALGLA